jgi:Asp-tRNA(Asn)/Glu-tRNA(Gln) amidotransferase A subunit family amidase
MPFLEASIPELQALMGAGQLTSRELTRAYVRRIRELNPTLHAVIETEPSAIAIAARLDVERRAGRVRGPLHGIPVLLKDNVATVDHTDTTAGSLALRGSRVQSDAPIVARLRDAGAVVFGKANLSEWARASASRTARRRDLRRLAIDESAAKHGRIRRQRASTPATLTTTRRPHSAGREFTFPPLSCLGVGVGAA